MRCEHECARAVTAAPGAKRIDASHLEGDAHAQE